MKELSVDPYTFVCLCAIVPDHTNGRVKAFMPQGIYQNHDNLPLHQYGSGPFCHFTIPKVNAEGVYVIQVNDQITYVGECENLSNRFNMGYGNISPRNCYVGGQATNCRINHHIYEMAVVNSHIKLYFLETNDRFEVERDLIEKVSPLWNIARGKHKPLSQLRRDENDSRHSRGRDDGNELRTEVSSVPHNSASCRDEVLKAAQGVVGQKGRNQFTVAEVLTVLHEQKSTYQESTIRTHIVSKCCVNAPRHHATTYDDFERVGPGTYRLYHMKEI